MKGIWLALGLAAVASVMANVGCSDDTSGSGGSAGSGSTTTGTTTTGTSTTATGTGGSGTTTTSTGATMTTTTTGTGGGGSGYADCSACSVETGAAAKECKTQRDACLADTGCKDLYSWAYNNTTTDKQGGCDLLAYIAQNNIPQGVVDKYKSLDDCIYCTTCKTICEPNSTAYCDAVKGTTSCP